MPRKLALANSPEWFYVDDEDYPWVREHTWRLHDDGHVVRGGDTARGEPTLVYLLNELESRRTGIPLGDIPPPAPVQEPDGDGDELSVGDYEQAVVAALAVDLMARVMDEGSGTWNFSDEMLADLLPVYGEDVVAGLNPELPEQIRTAITAKALAS